MNPSDNQPPAGPAPADNNVPNGVPTPSGDPYAQVPQGEQGPVDPYQVPLPSIAPPPAPFPQSNAAPNPSYPQNPYPQQGPQGPPAPSPAYGPPPAPSSLPPQPAPGSPGMPGVPGEAPRPVTTHSNPNSTQNLLQ